MRHISLSTCGLVKGIDRLAEEGLQITLSVSLHAPDDETRSRLMPVNRATGWRRSSPPATGTLPKPAAASHTSTHD